MFPMLPVTKRVESAKIRASAKGEACQIRLEGVCSFDPATTVFCHINGAGLALKAHDIHGFYGCHACHQVIDGQVNHAFSRDYLLAAQLHAMVRTQSLLLSKGLIVCK